MASSGNSISTLGGAQQSSSGANEENPTEYNYIDITDLLILPQKEAARRLGISESMLCKRFKECTRRKWPYRYVSNSNFSRSGIINLNLLSLFFI